MSRGLAGLTGYLLSLLLAAANPQPATLDLAGDWSVHVRVQAEQGELQATVEVPRSAFLSVAGERHGPLPVFNPNAGGWVKGAQLLAVRAQETTTPFLIDPESLVIRAGPGTDSEVFRLGVDYEADLHWGTFGRKLGGRILEGQTVFATYRHTLLRLDSIVLDPHRRIVFRAGQPQAAAPQPPPIHAGERRLANLWIPRHLPRLSPHNLFPILEPAYPNPEIQAPYPAETLLPRTLQKLRSGQPLRILAWGDSVTDGGYVPDPKRNRWQEQFVTRLRHQFPRAQLELVTEAWGGRNTGSYLAEPPGSPHNYREKVLGAKPDLVVSEFVNDAGLGVEQVQTRYARFQDDFRAIGAEWIVLTPHYVRPDWMGLDRERDIDDDPRPYVAGVRQFGARNQVAVADAARRYGRLWRQGIPHTSLMLNSINHPNAVGMALFADALMELFPPQ